MSSTYTPSLTLTQIGNGEQSGTWGTTTNNNWQLIEDAVAGVASISLSGTSSHTLSVANGTSDEARKAVLVATGATSGTCAIIAPLEPKVYVVSNQTSGGFAITIGATTGSVVTIPNGVTTLVYCDGTNFNSGITGFAGGNLTITGNIVASGSITASTINASLYGGAANQLVYQSGANSTSYISAPPSSGSATLLTYTPGSGFSWGTGSVSSLAGGTTNSVVYQSSPGTTAFLANPGTGSTYYLTYNNGLVWSTGGSVVSVTAASPLASSGGANPSISLSGVVPVANGGTGSASQNFVDLTTTQTIGGNKTFTGANTFSGTTTFTGTTTSQAYNFSQYTSIYYSGGNLYFAIDNGSSSFRNAIILSYNGRSVNVNGAPGNATWAFTSSLANSGGAGIAGVFDAAAYAGSSAIACQVNSTSSNLAAFYYGPTGSGSVKGSITTDGTSVFYNTSSDYRLKENVQPLTGAVDKVKALRPVSYTWKETSTSGEGFIAHELQSVVPGAVNGEKDAVDEKGNPKYQGIDPSKLVVTLTAALQEALARIEALEAKVNAK